MASPSIVVLLKQLHDLLSHRLLHGCLPLLSPRRTSDGPPGNVKLGPHAIGAVSKDRIEDIKHLHDLFNPTDSHGPSKVCKQAEIDLSRHGACHTDVPASGTDCSIGANGVFQHGRPEIYMPDVWVEVIEAVGASEECKHAGHEVPRVPVLPMIRVREHKEHAWLAISVDHHVSKEADLRGSEAGQEALEGHQIGKNELLAVDYGACLGVDSFASAEEREVAGGRYALVGVLLRGPVHVETQVVELPVEVIEGAIQGRHPVVEDGSSATQLDGLHGFDDERSVRSGQGLLVDDVSNLARKIPDCHQIAISLRKACYTSFDDGSDSHKSKGLFLLARLNDLLVVGLGLL